MCPYLVMWCILIFRLLAWKPRTLLFKQHHDSVECPEVVQQRLWTSFFTRIVFLLLHLCTLMRSIASITITYYSYARKSSPCPYQAAESLVTFHNLKITVFIVLFILLLLLLYFQLFALSGSCFSLWPNMLYKIWFQDSIPLYLDSTLNNEILPRSNFLLCLLVLMAVEMLAAASLRSWRQQ